MSREIKFRGLEMDSPIGINWIYGFYIEKHGKDYNGSPCVRYWINDGHEEFEVAKDTLGQFTGLKDNNGKEIYLGDIVRLFTNDFEKSVEKYNMDPNRWTFIVCFENGCYGIKPAMPNLHHDEDLMFSPFWCDEDKEMHDFKNTEIIGTIHENPELLQET